VCDPGISVLAADQLRGQGGIASDMAMLNDLTSATSLFETRRSGKARDLIEPGPSAAELDQILAAAMRVPDHGKLFPWLFHIIGKDQRPALASLMKSAIMKPDDEITDADLTAIDQFAHQAPTLVVVASLTRREAKIPIWEQQLSSGAACMQMLNAATALGYAGCWLTGWAAYAPKVISAFVPDTGMIAGFLYFGTPSRELQERPRPDFANVVRHWTPENKG
jgi:nitroreductase